MCLLVRGGKPVSSWGKGLNLCLLEGKGGKVCFIWEGGTHVSSL